MLPVYMRFLTPGACGVPALLNSLLAFLPMLLTLEAVNGCVSLCYDLSDRDLPYSCRFTFNVRRISITSRITRRQHTR